MSNESDDAREQRIHDAQLESRNRGGGKKQQQQQSVKSKKKIASTPKPKTKSVSSDSPGFLSGGRRDIVIAVAIGLIPAILAALLMPGALKLLAVVILVVAGGVGYLLGNQTA